MEGVTLPLKGLKWAFQGGEKFGKLATVIGSIEAADKAPTKE